MRMGFRSTLDPLTQVQDSTVPIRRFLRRGYSHHKRSFFECLFVGMRALEGARRGG